MPAAVGTVILVGGGLLTGGLEGTATAKDPGFATYKTFAKAEDFAMARETQRAGQERGTAFAHYHTGRQPLLGISFSTREWFRRVRIDNDIVGVFAEDEATEGAHRVVASPGFAVAAVDIQADEHINAIRVQFAALEGGALSPSDRYWSKWVGSYHRNEPTVLLEGGSALVVGLRGARGMVLNSLSLLIAQPEN
ncbi:MAG: hypothetical protein E4H37_05825 [Gemmatimonadales bacterium]|nr:MAG: hypothetical protein E4H37_05825 [Gemmatimonadales bacterium]